MSTIRLFLVLIVALFTAGCGLINTPATTTTTTTTLRGAYLGAFVDGLSNTAGFESKIGKNLAVNSIYIDWNTSFPATDCDTINTYGGVPMLTWEPYLNTTNSLDAISNGTYDTYITTFAQAAKTWGSLIYLRFGHEMNGNWYPWDGAHNGTTSGPAKYIAAWKHIHAIFTQAGATNVKWVWCPNHSSTPDESWNSAVNYYPGESYVDWIGLDGYNWGQGDWKTFGQIFGTAYSTFSTYSKPLMIAEFACAEEAGKANWSTSSFSTIESNYPNIKMVVWFNTNKERDWRISSTASAETAYKSAISDSYFLESKPVN